MEAAAATAAAAAASALVDAKEKEAQTVGNSPSESIHSDPGIPQAAAADVKAGDISESHVLIEEVRRGQRERICHIFCWYRG